MRHSHQRLVQGSIESQYLCGCWLYDCRYFYLNNQNVKLTRCMFINIANCAIRNSVSFLAGGFGMMLKSGMFAIDLW